MVPATGQGAQALAGLQDLLDDDVEARADRRLQRPRIACRVGQPVDVVDAQALRSGPRARAGTRSRACASKMSGLLDAQAGEGVDVEEAAIVDVARRDPPMGEPVGLRLQQPMQRPEAVGMPGDAVDERERPRSIASLHGRGGRRRVGEPPLQPLRLLREAGAPLGARSRRPCAQALGDRQELGQASSPTSPSAASARSRMIG